MEARIREELSSDEEIQAVGRAADITDASLEAQGDVVHLVVTNTHLRWARYPTFRVESLPLSAVIRVSERASAHRAAFGLDHAPTERARHRPAHRFLMFRWGNDVEVVPRTHTELRFSRRNTRAASALRSQLEARGFSWEVEDVPLPPADRRRVTIVPRRIS